MRIGSALLALKAGTVSYMRIWSSIRRAGVRALHNGWKRLAIPNPWNNACK